MNGNTFLYDFCTMLSFDRCKIYNYSIFYSHPDQLRIVSYMSKDTPHTVPGRPVIYNCGTSTEKASEFLDHHLQPILRAGKSYIQDTGHFSEVKGSSEAPENVLLVTANVASLYPNIPHEDGLRVLYTKLEKLKLEKKVSSESLVDLAGIFS